MIVAETFRLVVLPFGKRLASMGPRLDSRGNQCVVDCWAERHDDASMGPRLDSRGNEECGHEFSEDTIPLQWGRDLIVAETTPLVASAPVASTLQWGRDLIVAETAHVELKWIGAATLQWGRDLIVAETCVKPAYSPPALAASMGPRLDSRGNIVDACDTDEFKALQWGRDLIVAETAGAFIDPPLP